MNDLQLICLRKGYLLHPDTKVEDFKTIFTNKIPIDFEIDETTIKEFDDFFKGEYIPKFKDLEILLPNKEVGKKFLLNLMKKTKETPSFQKYHKMYNSL